MANPSKRYPWSVEMHFPAVDSWQPVAAYRDRDEALMQAELMRKRAPEENAVRIRHIDWKSLDDPQAVAAITF